MKNQKEIPQRPPVTLFIIFTLQKGEKAWGFRQMGLARSLLATYEGMRFGVLLGTGKGRGFSLRPDFRRYALLTSWENEAAASRFLKSASFYKDVQKKSEEVFTARLLPVLTKGKWKGHNPFTPLAAYPPDYTGPIIALTRARIRWQRLLPFWKHVPGVSAETGRALGLLAQTGMGEIPVIEQATLSIWENEKYLTDFAYKMRQHREVIQRTRSQHWYSEELFARFIPLTAEGSWNGQNPLAGKCWQQGMELL